MNNFQCPYLGECQIVNSCSEYCFVKQIIEERYQAESCVKELEEKQHIQKTKMQQKYEDLLGFDISELEDLSQEDKNILDNSTIKSLFNKNKILEQKLNAQFTEMEEKLTAEEMKNFELKEKLEIAEKFLIEMIKGEKLFTDKDYLFRAKLALQKMKEVENDK